MEKSILSSKYFKSEIETLTRIISIDNVIGNDVYAYADKN